MRNELMLHMKEIEQHPVFRNDYFRLLRETAFTPSVYAMHRANFYFRTMATVMGIAHICAAAAAHHDQDTLILFSYILNEECGEGDRARCHELLMEQAHNVFGRAEFDLAPLRVGQLEGRDDSMLDPAAAGLVLEESRHYRRQIHALLTRNYPTMLGVAYALETHASVMLTECREMFRRQRKHMAQDAFTRQVEVYFNCHLESGVEDRHAADAQQCILNNCVSESTLADIRHGIDATLAVQLTMWDGMYRQATRLLAQDAHPLAH